MIHQADGDNKYHSFLYCVFISSVIQIAMNGLNSIGLIIFSMLGETIAANPVSQQVATIHNKFVLDMTLLNLLLDKFLMQLQNNPQHHSSSGFLNKSNPNYDKEQLHLFRFLR